MKKIIFISLFVVLAGFFVGCSNKEQEVLYFYNWGDYIDEDLVEQFEEETGIRVISEYYDSNEAMYQKIKNGGSNYDLIIPSDYMVEKMINEDMLEEINYDNIPNASNINPELLDIEKDADPAHNYSVPYMWGTLGILYNKDMVDEEVNSWDILWDDKYNKSIFMYNSQRDSFAVALKRLGYSLNTTDPTELEEAKQSLIEQKPLVTAYVGDSVKDSMINNEAALAVVYSGDAVYCETLNDSLDFALPREGTNIFMDYLCIPKGAENKENAEKFINFLCDNAVATQNSNYIGYTSANSYAEENADESLRSKSGFIIDLNAVDLEFYRDLGDSIELYDKLWTEVLAN